MKIHRTSKQKQQPNKQRAQKRGNNIIMDNDDDDDNDNNGGGVFLCIEGLRAKLWKSSPNLMITANGNKIRALKSKRTFARNECGQALLYHHHFYVYCNPD